MTECGVVFPVLPGKREALVAFAQTILGERLAEYEASQVTVKMESWFLQPTPQGDLCIIYFVAADPGAVLIGLGESPEPFDIWFREQVLDITGVDLTQPPAGLPAQIFKWVRS